MIPGKVVVAGHEIPSWAQCYCVARHRPTPAHLLPYFLPGNRVMYLCPTAHHALSVWMKMCDDQGACPKEDPTLGFPRVVMRLGSLLWAVKSGKLTEAQYLNMDAFKRLSKELDSG